MGKIISTTIRLGTGTAKVQAVNQSINQSNIRLLTRRITRLTQMQAGFTEELGVGKIRITKEKC